MTRHSWTDDRLDERFDRLDGEIGALQVEVRETRTELRTEIKAVETNLRGEISGLETNLRGEISGLETNLRGEIGGVRGEIAALNRTLIRIGFGSAIALVVILVNPF